MLIATFFEAVGTILVQLIEIALLSKLLPFVMIAVGAYFLLSPNISDKDRAKNPHRF
ncbi:MULTISPECIES: hypothetical protein [Helicobacter]|uniref:hypothetical protein n=1 Tax=Helicobacter TaxID=209 RepID=UPI000A6BA58A|nr:hypothetical protein [Helicobacter apodemus]MDE6958939.1 hypothetical protein [Helicobacter apodemus]